MIRVNIVGAQRNHPHAQHAQRSQEWGPPKCKYYGSVKHNNDVVGILSLVAHDINPLTAKLFNLNFHPLEVLSR